MNILILLCLMICFWYWVCLVLSFLVFFFNVILYFSLVFIVFSWFIFICFFIVDEECIWILVNSILFYILKYVIWGICFSFYCIVYLKLCLLLVRLKRVGLMFNLFKNFFYCVIDLIIDVYFYFFYVFF